MDISQLGEDALINHISSKFALPRTLKGIGDDCAVIHQKNGDLWLVTTDALVEGVHFISQTITPRNLGYKAVQVNLSDIASMGGQPLHLFLTLGLPKTTDQAFFYELIEGIDEACKEASVLLLGGDTVAAPKEVFLSFTVMGEAKNGFVKYRSGGRAGDVICVTGNLGDSAAGLKLLLEKTEGYEELKLAHQRPHAHLAEGYWLAQHSDVHAMMDMSDGLLVDLPRLAKASCAGAEVLVENLPVSPLLQKLAVEEAQDPFSLALAGGEDYCLLFTVDEKSFILLEQEYQECFKKRFFPIGKIIESEGVVFKKKGIPFRVEAAPFKHF